MALLATIFFFGSLVLGFILLRLLPIKLDWAEMAAGAVVVGFLASGWLALISAWFFGYRIGFFMWALVVVATILLTWVGRQRFNFQLRQGIFASRRAVLVWGVTMLLTAVIFTPLFYSHMLQKVNGAYFSGGSTWGDLGLHSALTTTFAYSENLTWDLPLMDGAKLTYPFMIDFISGMLLRYGWSIQMALLVPGLLLSLAIVQLLFSFTYRASSSIAASALAPLLLIFNGSPAGIYYWWQDWRASGLSLWVFLGQMDVQYAHLVNHTLRFSNIVADTLLPQRGFLLGLATFLFITIMLSVAWDFKGQAQRHTLWFAGAMTGLLPLAHTHTFFVIVGIWTWLIVWCALRRRSSYANFLEGWVIMIVLAAPQLAWQLLSNYSSTFSGWHFGWTKGTDELLIIFWLKNMGLGFIMLFVGWWVAWKKRAQSSFLLHWFWPLFALFFIANVYLFQPHDWDNIKFLNFSYLAVVVVTAILVGQWLKQNYAWKVLAVLVVASLSVTGALSLLRESYTKWEFSSSEDVKFASQFRDLVPPTARVLTASAHNHPIPALTGRQIIMGYPGWLWTYGLDYLSVQSDVETMYAGGTAAEKLFEKYDVTHVVIGPLEKSSLFVNENYFSSDKFTLLETGLYNVLSRP